MKWWDQMVWSSFSECWILSQLFTLFFTFIKRLFSSSLLSAISVVSFAYLRLLIFLPAIYISACASSSPVFLMMYCAYKLNKQGDNIQPWHIVCVPVCFSHVQLFCDPMNCSLSGSSVHGILQVRILEWVAIPFSRQSSWPRDRTWVSYIARRFFTIWTTRETLCIVRCN